MRMNKRAVFVVTLGILFTLAYIIAGNPVVAVNNQRLQREVKAVDSNFALLNEIVPFKWDTLYTFEPYASEEEIEEIIGFKSSSIKETVSEGMVQLLFVRDKKVVSSVIGYGSALGYSIDFQGKIMFSDNAVFSVERDAEMIRFTHEH